MARFSNLARGRGAWSGELELDLFVDVENENPTLLPNIGSEESKVQRVATYTRSKSAAPGSCSSRGEKADGEMVLPKTFLTRTGALLLFTAPSSVQLSEEQKRLLKSSLTQARGTEVQNKFSTLTQFANSVLSFADEPYYPESQSDHPVMLDFLRGLDNRGFVDLHSKPGADPSFYLQDLKSRASSACGSAFNRSRLSEGGQYAPDAASRRDEDEDKDQMLSADAERLVQHYSRASNLADISRRGSGVSNTSHRVLSAEKLAASLKSVSQRSASSYGQDRSLHNPQEIDGCTVARGRVDDGGRTNSPVSRPHSSLSRPASTWSRGSTAHGDSKQHSASDPRPLSSQDRSFYTESAYSGQPGDAGAAQPLQPPYTANDLLLVAPGTRFNMDDSVHSGSDEELAVDGAPPVGPEEDMALEEQGDLPAVISVEIRSRHGSIASSHSGITSVHAQSILSESVPHHASFDDIPTPDHDPSLAAPTDPALDFTTEPLAQDITSTGRDLMNKRMMATSTPRGVSPANLGATQTMSVSHGSVHSASPNSHVPAPIPLASQVQRQSEPSTVTPLATGGVHEKQDVLLDDACISSEAPSRRKSTASPASRDKSASRHSDASQDAKIAGSFECSEEESVCSYVEPNIEETKTDLEQEPISPSSRTPKSPDKEDVLKMLLSRVNTPGKNSKPKKATTRHKKLNKKASHKKLPLHPEPGAVVVANPSEKLAKLKTILDIQDQIKANSDVKQDDPENTDDVGVQGHDDQGDCIIDANKEDTPQSQVQLDSEPQADLGQVTDTAVNSSKVDECGSNKVVKQKRRARLKSTNKSQKEKISVNEKDEQNGQTTLHTDEQSPGMDAMESATRTDNLTMLDGTVSAKDMENIEPPVALTKGDELTNQAAVVKEPDTKQKPKKSKKGRKSATTGSKELHAKEGASQGDNAPDVKPGDGGHPNPLLPSSTGEDEIPLGGDAHNTADQVPIAPVPPKSASRKGSSRKTVRIMTPILPEKTDEEKQLDELSKEVGSILCATDRSDDISSGGLSVEELQLEQQILQDKMNQAKEKLDSPVPTTKSPSKERTGKKEPGKFKKEKNPAEKKDLAKEREKIQLKKQEERKRRLEEAQRLQQQIRDKEVEVKQKEEQTMERKKVLEDDLSFMAAQAEEARQAEDDAREALAVARRIAREEREARRKAEIERKKMEAQQKRETGKQMAEDARKREMEMLGRIADGETRRKMAEEERIIQEEEEIRLEQEKMEEEERLRKEAEQDEDKFTEIERQAEEEAMSRLVKDRRDAEKRRYELELEAQQLQEEEEQDRLLLEEESRKLEAIQMAREEEERQRQEEEKKRLLELQRLEEEAREQMRLEVEKRRQLAMRRREQNLDSRRHLTGLSKQQGLTRPWTFSYYINWPRDTYCIPMGGDGGKKVIRSKSAGKRT